MWSDNETDIDLLGYHHLVGAVVGIVRTDYLLPATIGVFGDWGSGKSSLVQMACAELRADDHTTLVLPFNGWLFEGYEDAKIALMGTIVDGLASRRTLTAKGKDLVLRLVGRINFMRAAGSAIRLGAAYLTGGLPGLALGAAPDFAAIGAGVLEKAKDVKPEDLSEFLRDQDPGQQARRNVREFRDDFSKLLDETKLQRLVVVVDDLDRCNPDTIIETLEAIKLFLFVPKTAFVVGADERLVRYAVRRRFPELPGDNAEVGRDYLEKLIQFPVRIPPMGRAETDTYLKLLLAERCDLSNHAYTKMRDAVIGPAASVGARIDHRVALDALTGSIPPALAESLVLAEQVGPVLAAGLLGNPRQCKRFLNSLMMRLSMASVRKVELKRGVLAKLMLLEYFRPESFKELARLQAAQAGVPIELGDAEKKIEKGTPPDADSSDESDSTPPKATGATSRQGTPPRPVPRAEPSPFDPWRADPWLAEWLASEPPLSSIDLRHYFYFSRERLDPLAGISLRLSPEAQEVLTSLLGDVEATRTLSLKRASSLSPADAAAIFEALGSRARQSETSNAASNAPLPLMCAFVDRRAELFNELMKFLKSLSPVAVPFSLAPRLTQLASNAPERKPQLAALMREWHSSATGPLKQAAQQQLTKLTT
jgi:hypothetical protein